MNRAAIAALLLGALIVASALIHHGNRLASVATQMEALAEQTAELDRRLEAFSRDLPTVIEQAGRDAGRQAVHGVIEEAIQKPLSKVTSHFASSSSNITAQVGRSIASDERLHRAGIPLVRFHIPDPVVNIEILTDIQDLPSLPWRTPTGHLPVAAVTNHSLHAQPTQGPTETGARE